MDYTTKVLLETTSNHNEKNEIKSIGGMEKTKLDNAMVAKLYHSAISKSYVDFDTIPNSKGDVTQYEGYNNMLECLTTVKALANKSNTRIPEIEIVETTISHLRAYTKNFQEGFALRKEFIVLQYNTLVYACIEATSAIISSYVDYMKRVDTLEFTIVKNTKNGGAHCIDILDKFNASVKSGDFQKVLLSVIKQKESFMGVDDTVAGLLIAGSVLVIIPLIRELIFYFYYSRMKVSDYLKQQAMLIEINKIQVESKNIPAKDKKAILKKQEGTMNKLLALSEKVKVDHKLSDTKSMQEIKKEEKSWSLDSLKKDVSNSDSNFTLL